MRRCLVVAVVLWPGMTSRRHRTWHPTPSQYTDTGPTCRCAIHWCGTSHWNTQLPILMYWVWPDREISPHTPANSQLYAVIVVVSRKLGRKFYLCALRHHLSATYQRWVCTDLYVSLNFHYSWTDPISWSVVSYKDEDETQNQWNRVQKLSLKFVYIAMRQADTSCMLLFQQDNF